jgi:hypothetical protein
MAQGYCYVSKARWAIETGEEKELQEKSKMVYLHMWKICDDGKYCPSSKESLKSLLKGKQYGDTHIGPCFPDKLE